jgi:hypothetical protein
MMIIENGIRKTRRDGPFLLMSVSTARSSPDNERIGGS